MNILQKTLTALITGSVLTVGAQAAVNNMGYTGQPYVGAKVGKLGVDVEKRSSDKATAYGVYGGYSFDPNFGAEVEYLSAEEAEFNEDNFKGNVTAKTYGAYGTYRYYLPNSSFYGKGKLGIAKTDVESKIKITENGKKTKYSNKSEGKVKVAGGVGIGFAATPNIGIEAEYAKVGGDLDAMTIGANFKF